MVTIGKGTQNYCFNVLASLRAGKLFKFICFFLSCSSFFYSLSIVHHMFLDCADDGNDHDDKCKEKKLSDERLREIIFMVKTCLETWTWTCWLAPMFCQNFLDNSFFCCSMMKRFYWKRMNLYKLKGDDDGLGYGWW